MECWKLVHIFPDTKAAEWLRAQDNIQLVAVEDILSAVIWMQTGNKVRTLLPYGCC